MLNILVIHGYVQSAALVARNTAPLKTALADIATLHYVDGPPLNGSSAPSPRPWWILENGLGFNKSLSARWDETVKYWSDLLSQNQYDGIIGLSQGSAMAALLVAMINDPEKAPGFAPKLTQPIKFAILCSGFISGKEPHASIYEAIPEDLPTLHTVDPSDGIVPAANTIALQKLFPDSKLREHSEGHAVPVRGRWPSVMRTFIQEACHIQPNAGPGSHFETDDKQKGGFFRQLLRK